MKKLNSLWVFACGTAVGVGLTLCVGAADNAAAPAPATPAIEKVAVTPPPPPPVQMVTYASGVTGFFDPTSGRIYLYDVDMKNCYQVRQITKLGYPMTLP